MRDDGYKEFWQTKMGFTLMLVGVPALIAGWYFGVVALFGLFF